TYPTSCVRLSAQPRACCIPLTTSAARRPKPERATSPEPESPRSSSITTNALRGPSQVGRLVNQCILAICRFTIVFHPGGAGLAQIDDGGAREMTGGNLGVLSHGLSPAAALPRACR